MGEAPRSPAILVDAVLTEGGRRRRRASRRLGCRCSQDEFGVGTSEGEGVAKRRFEARGRERFVGHASGNAQSTLGIPDAGSDRRVQSGVSTAKRPARRSPAPSPRDERARSVTWTKGAESNDEATLRRRATRIGPEAAPEVVPSRIRACNVKAAVICFPRRRASSGESLGMKGFSPLAGGQLDAVSHRPGGRSRAHRRRHCALPRLNSVVVCARPVLAASAVRSTGGTAPFPAGVGGVLHRGAEGQERSTNSTRLGHGFESPKGTWYKVVRLAEFEVEFSARAVTLPRPLQPPARRLEAAGECGRGPLSRSRIPKPARQTSAPSKSSMRLSDASKERGIISASEDLAGCSTVRAKGLVALSDIADRANRPQHRRQIRPERNR